MPYSLSFPLALALSLSPSRLRTDMCVWCNCREKEIQQESLIYMTYSLLHLECQFHLNLQSQSPWSLFNGTWQKRPRELDDRLRIEIEEMTLQMQQGVPHSLFIPLFLSLSFSADWERIRSSDVTAGPLATTAWALCACYLGWPGMCVWHDSIYVWHDSWHVWHDLLYVWYVSLSHWKLRELCVLAILAGQVCVCDMTRYMCDMICDMCDMTRYMCVIAHL